MNLKQATMEELKAEIKKRELEAAEKEAIERESRKITIECPVCNGKGFIGSIGAHDPMSGPFRNLANCSYCNGTKQMKAYKVKGS